MKKGTLLILLTLLATLEGFPGVISSDTTVYLITCAPGTATYSIYGHSALRVVIPNIQSDMVYNWGVFDFDTPNFVWKFAKGRLNYKLDKSSYNSFLQDYVSEKRSVWIQKINFERDEIVKLINMINENLKPENIYYRYDFFYDNCSTRIRDLIEKASGNSLIYPPEVRRSMQTFRWSVGEYQKPYPWLKLGVDLIMGTPADKKASFRDRMFLPVDLMNNLGKAVINRNYQMIPLLQNPQTVLEFDPPVIRHRFYTEPFFVFTLLFILVIFLSSMVKRTRLLQILDLILFIPFAILSILMIFFNFFTDHEQMRWNLNIIWLSPFCILCLISLITGKNWTIWFRFVFFLCALLLALIIVVPGVFNSSFIPVILLLALRSSVRGEFEWNPLSISSAKRR